jgi:hypothetical protein
MTKNAKKNTKNAKKKEGFRGLWLKTKGIFQKNPTIAYGIVTIALMLGVFSLEQGAKWFKASILEVPQFDGTVMPVEKVPNWAKVGGANKKHYNDYAAGDFIEMPKYDAAQLASGRNDATTMNAKITYSVVYMGNYKLDHQENAGSHLAVDIKIPVGTPIFSVANGVVSKVDQKTTGFGKHICVKHVDVPVEGQNQTIYSCYNHLDAILVNQGDIVQKGQHIANSGNTGTSTTPHLHFQIDTENAPWHPWWPFSSQQASAANLSFFEAVNAGLGKSEAQKNTIHPFNWIQANLSGRPAAPTQTTNQPTPTPTPVADSTTTLEPKPAPTRREVEALNIDYGNLGSFQVSADKSQVEPNEKVTVTIVALDQNANLIADFNGSQVRLTSSDPSINLSGLNFKNGIAKVSIVPKNNGVQTFTFQAGSVSETLRLNVGELPGALASSDQEPEESKETNNQAVNEPAPKPETSPEPEVPAVTQASKIEIKGQTSIKKGNTTLLDVIALNSAGEPIANFAPRSALQVGLRGQAELDPKILTAANFNNGEATIAVTGTEEDLVQVNIVGYPESTFNLRVVGTAEPVSYFRVTMPRSLSQGQTSTVTITALNEQGEVTERAFNGVVDLNVVEGEGRFTPSELTSADFSAGKAEVSFTPTTSNTVKVKAQSGVLVGTSDRVTVSEQSGFSDLAASDPFAEAVLDLQEKGVINGFADGTFRPDESVTRVAALKMILFALDIEIQEGQVAFSDTVNSEWYRDILHTGLQREIVNGFPDGTFRPAGEITRAAFFKILLETGDVELPEVSFDPFSDVPKDEWFASYAKYARNNDLLSFADGRFYPAREMTRAEVAQAIYRFLETQN